MLTEHETKHMQLIACHMFIKWYRKQTERHQMTTLGIHRHANGKGAVQ